MSIWSPPDTVAVLIDIVVWGVWGTLVGYVFHRLPAGWFAADDAITRIRRWERRGQFWVDHTGVRRWKGRLPEAGALFAGGFSKRHLRTRDVDYLERFLVETRRAELVHWVVAGIAPLFFLWNPPWLAAVMIAYGLAANLPCVITQRYNRARLQRILARAVHPTPSAT
jgi:glycosyl-4,4'-diaponeurosporenoate acyltransferase